MHLSDLAEALEELDFQDESSPRCSCEDHECGLAWDALRRIEELLANGHRVAGLSNRPLEQILDSALQLAGAETLLWVPAEREQHALVLGKPWLSPREARQLLGRLPAEARHPNAVYLSNDPMAEAWSAGYHELINVLCVRAPGTGNGWLIALNRPGGFHPRCASVLAPFAALAAREVRQTGSRQRAISAR